MNEPKDERLAALAPLPDDFTAPEPLPPTPHRDRVLEGFPPGGASS